YALGIHAICINSMCPCYVMSMLCYMYSLNVSILYLSILYVSTLYVSMLYLYVSMFHLYVSMLFLYVPMLYLYVSMFYVSLYPMFHTLCLYTLCTHCSVYPFRSKVTQLNT